MQSGEQTIDTSMSALPRKDGRHRRVDRSKQAALAACREMMMGGVFQPTVANVASRAKLSVRTIFQHFGTVDALHLEAIRDGVVRDAIIDRVLGEAWVNDGGPEEWFDRIARAVVLGRA